LAGEATRNIGIGCTRTSTNEYPSVCIMMKAVTDPVGTMRPSVRAVPGTAYFRYAKYKLLPWGNYSATCIDPSDPRRLWTYQEYANSTNDWPMVYRLGELPTRSNQIDLVGAGGPRKRLVIGAGIDCELEV